MPPDDQGTAPDPTQADQPVPTGAETAPGSQPGATHTEGPPPQESFIDPSQLPEDIKPHWRRMHGAYTKRLEEIRTRQGDLDLVDRYRGDPDFAKQFLAQEAARLGLTVGTPSSAASPAPTGTAKVPAEFVEAVKAELPPELQWMAPATAAAVWGSVQRVMTPFVQRSEQQDLSQREAVYDTAAAELTDSVPGWEEHEADMLELLDFLESPGLTHKRFGNKLAILHAIVTGPATATAAAVRRMSEAGRQRTVTGQSGRSTVPNIEERVRKAPTRQEAWKIAAEHAVEELRKQGVTVPP